MALSLPSLNIHFSSCPSDRIVATGSDVWWCLGLGKRDLALEVGV